MEISGQGELGRMLAVSGDQAERTRLERAADRAAEAQNDRALGKTAREFEGVFLNTLLKAMRQTVPVSDLFNGGGATKFYRQMHDAEIARSLATGHSGMGIADMIVRQLSREPNDSPGRVPGVGSPVEPPVPGVVSKYREAMGFQPTTGQRKRLALLAARQGSAVADTLSRFGREIEIAASRSGLDEALILSVVMEESGGDPGVTSNKGAVGLMQLMPATARELGVADPRDAAQNLQGGARYLAQMLARYSGQLELALAAYNAGPGTVDRLGGNIPPYAETERYVQRVLDRYEKLGAGTHLASPDP
jgi:Rod binding domain-containing protein